MPLKGPAWPRGPSRSTDGQKAELSAQTFCTFPHEFSSITWRGFANGGDANPERPPGYLLPFYWCDVRSPVLGFAARRMPVFHVVGTMVRRPLRLTGSSRTTPIGWLQRVPGARRSRRTSGPLVSCPPFRNTSRQASVRETPNAAAHGCVRRPRTPPGDGRGPCCPTGGGRAIGASASATTLQSWNWRTSAP